MVPIEQLRPVSDFVVVRKAAAREMAGSLFVPEAHQGQRLEGEVVAIGPGRVNKRGVFVPTEVKVGQRVLLPAWHGKDIKALGDDIVVIAEEMVLAVFEDEAA